MILVVSHPADEHAAGVLEALNRAGYPCLMMDTAQFPSNASLTQRFGNTDCPAELTTAGQSVDLSTCHAGWWRRPQPFTLRPGLSQEAASFAYTECHEAVAGLWASLDLAWVNPPGLDETAHHKPYQLSVARKVGLEIPRTAITNDPRAARSFIQSLGRERTIYKTFLASEQHWRETRILRPEEMDMLDLVELAPVIFQEYVPAVADIRATVIGSTILAAEIRPTQGGYEIDYRMDLDGAHFVPAELPAEVTDKLHTFMQRLGLVYGAIDLRKTPDGRYVFLEVNPAGEWRFVEDRTQQPITETMAELLMDLDRNERS